MIQKILSFSVILSLLFGSFSVSFASYNEEHLLSEMGEYRKYALELQEIIPSLSEERLETLEGKLYTLKENPTNDEEFNNFVIYLYSSIPTKEDTVVLEIKDVTDLTPTEERTLAREIKFIESNMKEEIQDFLDSTISSWNSLNTYEESGDIQAKMKLAVQGFMNLDTEINFSDYINQVQVLDQSFSADVDGYYNFEFWGQEIDLSGETNLSLISQGGDIYIKLANTQLESSDEGVQVEITPFIEALNELGESDTYLAFMDHEGDEILTYLENFNGTALNKEIEEIFKAPLFEAYGKNESGYLLRPTKHFCDMGKKITRVFDPFSGETCSEGQYENMLEDFHDSGAEISLSLGTETVLSISNAASADAYEKVNIEMIWRNKSLREATLNIYDANDPSISYMNAVYTPGKSLSLFSDVEGDLFMDILMNFNRDSSIKDMKLDMTIEDTFTVKSDYSENKLYTSIIGGDQYFMIDCGISGDIMNNFADIAANCKISGDDITRDLGYTTDQIELESTFSYDSRNEKNNFSFVLDAFIDEKNYFFIDIENIGKRNYSSQREIFAPRNSVDYLEFLFGIDESESYNYYDSNYEYTYEEYDEYTESCYIYTNGDTDCSKFYDDRSETCSYTAESQKETCTTYDYGYEVKTHSFDDHETTCYNYDDGSSTCYEYYDDKTNTCYIETDGSSTCEEYKYNYDYEINEYSFDDHETICYDYDDSSSTCYEYYDDKTNTCYIEADGSSTCEEYIY